jgi:hypothetical protein
MLLGTGLSSFYFLSALANAKYFPVSRLPLWSYVEGHLLTLSKVLEKGSDGFIPLMAVTVVDMIAVCILCGVFVLAKGNLRSKKSVLFWLMICVIPVLLMHGRSARIWHMCPPLFAAIQYPWRLNIVLCIAALPILALFLSEMPKSRPFVRASLLISLFVLLVPWLVSYARIWARYRVETARQMTSVDDDDGWFLAWTAPGTNDVSALRASSGPQLIFLEGTGTANVLLWTPRHIEFVTNSSTGGQVMINQFYYPPWRASDNDSQAVQVRAKAPEGLLEVTVPPGIQRIRLDIPLGPMERIGRWVSGLCVFVSVALLWAVKPHNSPRHVLGIVQMISNTGSSVPYESSPRVSRERLYNQ